MKYTLVFLSLLLVLTVGCIYIPEEIKNIGTPVVNTFEATPSLIDVGNITYLSWKVSNAQSVQIDNGIGDVALNGTFPVSPNATTSYTLTARNAIGIANARTQIIVRNAQYIQPMTITPAAPRINLFLSDRMNILPGEDVILRWSVLDATKVMLTPIGIVNTDGEISVHPSETTTYTLIATNSAGDSMTSLTITVLYSLTPASVEEITLVLNALADESGSLVKGTRYLDYMKQESAWVGDTSSNLASRAFLSFDISSIPENAVVEEVILDLSQYVKTGDPTYVRSMWGNMGALEVYHVQYGRFDDLGLFAYNQAAKLTQNGVFMKYPLSSWAWDVKNASDESPVIQNLIQSGSIRSQFRIQFFTSTNWDGVSDAFCFDNATLKVKYMVIE